MQRIVKLCENRDGTGPRLTLPLSLTHTQGKNIEREGGQGFSDERMLGQFGKWGVGGGGEGGGGLHSTILYTSYKDHKSKVPSTQQLPALNTSREFLQFAISFLEIVGKLIRPWRQVGRVEWMGGVGGYLLGRACL